MLEILIKELSDNPDGLSYWSLYKECRDKYSIILEPSVVRYHLEKLHKNGFLSKRGSKYILPAPVVAINGSILFTKPPAIVNCPYYKTCNRKKSACLKDNCKFLNDFSDEFKDYLKKIFDVENGVLITTKK